MNGWKLLLSRYSLFRSHSTKWLKVLGREVFRRYIKLSSYNWSGFSVQSYSYECRRTSPINPTIRAILLRILQENTVLDAMDRVFDFLLAWKIIQNLRVNSNTSIQSIGCLYERLLDWARWKHQTYILDVFHDFSISSDQNSIVTFIWDLLKLLFVSRNRRSSISVRVIA